MLRRWAAGIVPFLVLVPAACSDAPAPRLERTAAVSTSKGPPPTSSTTTTTSTSTTTTTAPPETTTTAAEEPATVDAPSDIEGIIRAEFGSRSGEALRVAWCESRYEPTITNGPSRGLFQVHEVHAEQWLELIGRSYWTSWDDPVANAAFAHWLLDQERHPWSDWSCKP